MKGTAVKRQRWMVAAVTAFCLVGSAYVGTGAASAAGAAVGSGAAGVRSLCASTPETTYRPGKVLHVHCDVAVPTGTGSRFEKGLDPAELQAAYKLRQASATRGVGQTVAVVEAFDDPTAAADLAVYRSTYKLPPCTPDSGCLTTVNQDGQSSPLPAGNTSWALEISLDLDMVSAICPNCHILLVEADSTAITDLGTAEDTAATMGAQVISDSWGAADAPDATYGQYFDHPGSAIVASGGDTGFKPDYPADSQYVTGVGGTTLTRARNKRGWSEAVWYLTGAGCSAYNAKPAWQSRHRVKDAGCTMRTQNDVAADADPYTGALIYDTYNAPGWQQVGGTSEATPIIAAVYALAGNAAQVDEGSYPYAHSAHLFDVTHGYTNGFCTPKYLCNARVGYDGPSGLGTPKGYLAF